MGDSSKRKISIEYDELVLANLSQDLKVLLERAQQALKNAYAPYSAFKVGAAVLLDNGQIIIGNNQENAAYPSGLCAERVALFAARSQYPNAVIKAIAVTAEPDTLKLTTPVSPCGSCRQVMAEYELHNQGEDIQVILGGSEDKVWLFENVSCLLPLTFRGEGVRKENNTH
jgi:cytidine deaminase